MPTVPSKRRQEAEPAALLKMIAREQHALLLVEEDSVPPRMPRLKDDPETAVKLPRTHTLENHRPLSGRKPGPGGLRRVHDAGAAEALTPPNVVGDVVNVRHVHVLCTPEGNDSLGKGLIEAGTVHQHIASLPHQKICRCSVALWAVVSQMIDVTQSWNREREAQSRLFGEGIGTLRADAPCWTRHHCLEGSEALLFALGLHRYS
mmetsp:Transcript_3220/g.7423  ORF Transcript_3220/g.7423 Transcript_3220/m.7423 type:complete len:205 (+) Transcript_3220:176-790(+)